MPTYEVFNGDHLLATVDAESIDEAVATADIPPSVTSCDVFLEAESPRKHGTFAYAARYAAQLRNAATLIEAIPSLAPMTDTQIGDHLYTFSGGKPLEQFQRFAASAAEATGKAGVTAHRRQASSGDLRIEIVLGDLVQLACNASADLFRPKPAPAPEWPALVEATLPEAEA